MVRTRGAGACACAQQSLLSTAGHKLTGRGASVCAGWPPAEGAPDPVAKFNKRLHASQLSMLQSVR